MQVWSINGNFFGMNSSFHNGNNDSFTPPEYLLKTGWPKLNIGAKYKLASHNLRNCGKLITAVASVNKHQKELTENASSKSDTRSRNFDGMQRKNTKWSFVHFEAIKFRMRKLKHENIHLENDYKQFLLQTKLEEINSVALEWMTRVWTKWNLEKNAYLVKKIQDFHAGRNIDDILTKLVFRWREPLIQSLLQLIQFAVDSKNEFV